MAKAEEAELSITIKVLGEGRIAFDIDTTIPLPVEVLVGVSLKDQAPDDVFVGYSEKYRIEKSQSSFVLDTRLAKDPLPDGEYEAEVTFYPRWGAKNGNPDAKAVPELRAKEDISLSGTGIDRESAEKKNELQRWVMLNLEMNMRWDRGTFEEKLGKAVKGPSTMSHLHDAYYFPDPDVTLLVNRLKNEMTVWRLGNVTE
ncbi:MAG: hypothetical protein AAF559_10075 [Pseudomonadota bacterium]